jgi:acyl-CoA synthetase (NDP forming)
LTAEVLAANHGMLHVLRDSGIPMSSIPQGDDISIVLHLDHLRIEPADTDGFTDAVLHRQALADAASLRPVFQPCSLAVVGVGRRPDSVGRLILRSILDGGFAGPVYAINPHADEVEGVPCVASMAELPRAVDLAVICVPADAVPDVAEQCGRRGVRALLVITAGISGSPALAGRLTAALGRHGMRTVGPNCLGLVNTDPHVAVQATFGHPVAGGQVGVAAQSGGVVIAITAELDRLGLGASTVVSTGDSVDVNADDMLLWWAQDGRTRAAVLYVESLRRPRVFAILARRLARRIPVLTVRSGSSEAGRSAAASHSAGSATPRAVCDALFAQTGVLAVDEITELPGLLALCRQPLPAGPRVAVLSNAGGAGVLAAGACVRAGLQIAVPETGTRAALTALLPGTAAVADPVDTTATVPAAVFGRALELLLSDPGVDAVLALGAPTGTGDPLQGVGPIVAAGPGKPVATVRLGQAETVTLPVGLHPDDVASPVFAEPAAARALAAAARRATWLRRPSLPARTPLGVDATAVHVVVADAINRQPEGGRLEPQAATALARSAGLPVLATTVVHGVEAAMRTWRTARWPADPPPGCGSRADGPASGRSVGTCRRERVSPAEPQDREARGLPETVGDDQRGPPLGGGQQLGGEGLRGGRVEVGGGLVEEQHRPVGEQRPGHPEALTLPARDRTPVFPDRRVEAVGQRREPTAELRGVQHGEDVVVAGARGGEQQVGP